MMPPEAGHRLAVLVEQMHVERVNETESAPVQGEIVSLEAEIVRLLAHPSIMRRG